MSWRNTGIGMRIGLFALTVLLVTAVLSVVVISSNNRLRNIVYEMHEEKLQGVYYGGHLQAEALYHFAALYRFVISKGTDGVEDKEHYEEGIQEYLGKLSALGLTAQEQAVVEQFAEYWSQYLAAAKELPSLVQQGRNTEAMSLLAGELSVLSKQADTQLVELVDFKRAAAKQYFEESMAAVANARSMAIILIVGGTVLLMTVAVVITRSITRPLAELVASAKTLSAGDLTAEVAVRSGDETGKVAAAIQIMAANFQELVRQIGMKANLVAASSEELSASSQQTTSISEQNTATAAEMANTAKEVAASVQQIAVASSKATGVAGEGGNGVLRVAGQMQSIVQATEEIGAVIDGLSKKSRDIDQITRLITEVAEQTNLLALNAAIEAARAGEQGRGFAVVADEVRKLAEQSGRAAAEINKLIQAIQAEASEAVNKMEQSGREVAAGTRLAQEVGNSFTEITGAISGLTERLQEVDAAVTEMVGGIQGVAAASEEQSAAAEEVASSSAALAVLAEELNALIGKFKY